MRKLILASSRILTRISILLECSSRVNFESNSQVYENSRIKDLLRAQIAYLMKIIDQIHL